jgi:rsbT antagonist protein RsbS
MTPRSPFPLLRVRGYLLVAVNSDLSDGNVGAFQHALLLDLESRPSKGLVIDISGLEMLDSYVARMLVNTARMAGLMGVETALVGVRPEVAATLVTMGFVLTGVLTALDVDDGLDLLGRRRAAQGLAP